MTLDRRPSACDIESTLNPHLLTRTLMAASALFARWFIVTGFSLGGLLLGLAIGSSSHQPKQPDLVDFLFCGIFGSLLNEVAVLLYGITGAALGSFLGRGVAALVE